MQEQSPDSPRALGDQEPQDQGPRSGLGSGSQTFFPSRLRLDGGSWEPTIPDFMARTLDKMIHVIIIVSGHRPAQSLSVHRYIGFLIYRFRCYENREPDVHHDFETEGFEADTTDGFLQSLLQGIHRTVFNCSCSCCHGF